MEWFAFSSKFYLDLDDQGVSEPAQMLLMRICAYVADNETSGRIAASAIKKLGVRQAQKRLDELLDHHLIIEVEREKVETRDELAANSRTTRAPKRNELVANSAYEIPAWFKWNEPLERLVRKRKADRKRIAETRADTQNVARQSHDRRAMSHDHINSNKNKEQETHPLEASPVSTARDAQPRGPALPIDGWKLVRTVIPENHPQAVKTALALQAGTLLKAGTPATTVEAALHLWMAKTNCGPGLLPSLVSEALKAANPTPHTHRPSTADQRVAQAQAVRARLEAQANQHGTPKELTP